VLVSAGAEAAQELADQQGPLLADEALDRVRGAVRAES
jgi:hypothetical protein